MDFSIGEFSRITGLSIKALRLYHEKEILIPSHIDPSTSYRYYDSASVGKAKIIVYLRDMEFALTNIKDILNNYEDEANLFEALIRQKERISDKIRRYRSVMQILDDIIAREREAAIALEKNPLQVEEKQLESTFANLKPGDVLHCSIGALMTISAMPMPGCYPISNPLRQSPYCRSESPTSKDRD